jgi:hypothetical protein
LIAIASRGCNARRRAVSRHPVRGALLLVIGLGLASAARAQAAPGGQAAGYVGPRFVVPDGALRWSGPAECDGSELPRMVSASLDHPMPAGRFAEVAVTRGGDGTYHAVLRIRAGSGDDDDMTTRTVDGRDCAQVLDAAALVIGMAVAAGAAALPPEAPGAGVAAERELEPPPGTVALRLRGAADTGAIPGGALGVDGGITFTRGRIIVVGSGRWFPRRFAPLEGTRGAGVDVGLAGAAVQLCTPVIGVAACGGGEVGLMNGTGVGVAGASTQRSTWAALTAGVVAGVPVGRIRAIAELGGYFAFQRPRFVLDSSTAVYQPSLIGARAYVGIEVPLW